MMDLGDGMTLLVLTLNRILVHSKKACDDKLKTSYEHEGGGECAGRGGFTTVLVQERREGSD